jgi:hypothetical protein
MPISQYYRNAVLHRCEACGNQRRLLMDDLEFGLLPDAFGEVLLDATSRAQPVVSMPPCEECGSVEIVTPYHKSGDSQALWAMLDGKAAFTLEPACDLDMDDPADEFAQDC